MRLPALLILLIALPALGNGPDDFAARFPIEADNSSAAWRVTLDEAVYRWSQDRGLRDVAIFNAEGRAVPVASWFDVPGERIERQQVELPAFALPEPASTSQAADWNLVIERDGAGRVRRIQSRDEGNPPLPAAARNWLLDASALDRNIDSISLDWSDPRDGIVARFRVEGSDDLQTWRSLRDEAVIVRLQRDGIPIERREIDLPGQRNRYLRLVRLDAGDALHELTCIATSEQRSREAGDTVRWMTPRWSASIAGTESAPNRHLYDLPASMPVDLVRIRLTNDNALAELELLALEPLASNRTRWQSRARLVAFRLQQDGTRIDNADIALSPALRTRALQIHSMTPLAEPPQVQIGYRPEHLVFLSEGDGPFVLAVGSARERRADYPVETALKLLRAEFGPQWQPPLAKLGAVQALAAAPDPRAAETASAWRRNLLWLVLIGATLVIATIAIRLLRDPAERGAVEGQQPPEEKSPPG